MKPPAPGRLYWVCQAAGWGAFLAWVLGSYLLTASVLHAWDIVSIIGFNGVVCPAVSHRLRRWMYAKEVHQWPAGRMVPVLSAIVLAVAAVLTSLVAAGVFVASGGQFPGAAIVGVFLGFSWAFAGWLLIYFAVHARRRRDALQLELAVVAREAQLGSLRAQLNPHFLFNCLNSLRHLIAADPRRAETMVTGLAELLRYSLASDRVNMVPLAEELRVVDEYLDLEHVRLEERLRIERDIEPAALRAQVPPMLIQTLVDNAIKHGIAELPLGGTIRIEARVANGRVDVVITNTGGLKPLAPGGGHGLNNVRERLRLLYPGTASLSLRELNGHTQAMVTVPLESP